MFQRIAITFDEMGAAREALREVRPVYAPVSRLARRDARPRGLCDEVSAAHGADDSPCGCAALAALLLFVVRSAAAAIIAVSAVVQGVHMHPQELGGDVSLWMGYISRGRLGEAPCRSEASWLILLGLALGVEQLVELSFFLLALAIRTCAARCARSLAPASLVYAWMQLVELCGNVYVLRGGVKLFFVALQEKLADSALHPEQSCTKEALVRGAYISGVALLVFAIGTGLKLIFAILAACSPRKAWIFAAVGAAPFRAIAGEWSSDGGGAFAPLRTQEMARR